jgi:hypothetical protein
MYNVPHTYTSVIAHATLSQTIRISKHNTIPAFPVSCNDILDIEFPFYTIKERTFH